MNNAINRHIKKNWWIIVLFLILIITELYLFKDLYRCGMHYDEVNRTNAWFPIFNHNAASNPQAIWSITLFGKSIPIMYKDYISSLGPILNLPALLSDSPLFTLKTLHIILYNFSLLLLFVALYRYGKTITGFVVLLCAFNPILFPDINVGFANIVNIAAFSIILMFLRKYYYERKNSALFWAAFFAAFNANIAFYYAWDIASFIIATLILNPKEIKQLFSSIKRVICLLCGIALGIPNFILYNVLNGFPTIKRFLGHMVDKSNSFDGVANNGLIENFKIALSRLNIMLGGLLGVYIVLAILVAIGWVIVAKLKLVVNRNYYYPVLMFVLIIALLFISPNIRFSYHWIHLSPYFEISIVALTHALAKSKTKETTRMRICVPVLSCITVFMIVSSVNNVRNENYILPDHEKSSDFYSLNRFIEEHDIDSKTVVLEWGIDAQLYFLNRGEFFPYYNRYNWLLNADENRVKTMIGTILSNSTEPELYFPLFYEKDGSLNANTIRTALFQYCSENDIRIEAVKYSDTHQDEQQFVDFYRVPLSGNSFSALLEEVQSQEIPTISTSWIDIKLPVDSRVLISGWAFVEDDTLDRLFVYDPSENKICSSYLFYGSQRSDVMNAYHVEYALNSGFQGECELSQNSRLFAKGASGKIYEISLTNQQYQTNQVYQINPKLDDYYSESDHMARFDIQSETESIDVFYDTGSGFSESQKSTLSLFDNDYYILEVPYDLDLLRIDFMTADTSVEISEIYVRINEDEYLLNGPELQLLIAGYHSISSPELDGDSLIFECVGPDPYIVFDVP